MIKYKKIDHPRYKYELLEDYEYELHFDNPLGLKSDYFMILPRSTLIIEAGYCWDGCSGPTIDTKSTMRAGLVHDALYQAMREGLLSTWMKRAADDELLVIMTEDGSGWWGRFRAAYYHQAVVIFGGSSCEPN